MLENGAPNWVGESIRKTVQKSTSLKLRNEFIKRVVQFIRKKSQSKCFHYDFELKNIGDHKIFPFIKSPNQQKPLH